MQLNDKCNTVINVNNVCFVRKQDEQMQGRGGLVVVFTGRTSLEVFEYDKPEILDSDFSLVRSLIACLEK